MYKYTDMTPITNCHAEMKVIALIDDRAVIEKILKHLNLWLPSEAARAPPASEGLDDWDSMPCSFSDSGFRSQPSVFPVDPFPDYDTEVVVAGAAGAGDLTDAMPNYDVVEAVFTE
jgi:hypothetical protein